MPLLLSIQYPSLLFKYSWSYEWFCLSMSVGGQTITWYILKFHFLNITLIYYVSLKRTAHSIRSLDKLLSLRTWLLTLTMGEKVNNVIFLNSFKMYRAKFVLEIENNLSRLTNLLEIWILYCCRKQLGKACNR